MLCVEGKTKCEYCGGTAKLEIVQRNPNSDKEAEIPYIAVYECGCGKTTFVNIENEAGKVNTEPISSVKMLDGVKCKLVATRGMCFDAVVGGTSYNDGEIDKDVEDAMNKGNCPLGYIIRSDGVALNEETNYWYIVELWKKFE